MQVRGVMMRGRKVQWGDKGSGDHVGKGCIGGLDLGMEVGEEREEVHDKLHLPLLSACKHGTVIKRDM